MKKQLDVSLLLTDHSVLLHPTLPATVVQQLETLILTHGGSVRVMVEAADAAATATAHHGKAYVCVMSLSVVSTPLVNLPHVTPAFFLKSVEFGKIQSPIHYSADPAKFLSGIIVAVDHTQISTQEADVLFGAVECFGGQICLELTAEVTHFICNDANTSEIYKQATASTTGVTKTTTPSLVAILPHWLDDCFKTQRLLDVDNYAFPDPPLLLLTPEDLLRKRLEMKKKKSAVTSSPSRQGFLKGQCIYLDPLLIPHGETLEALIGNLQLAGAAMVQEYHKSICTAVVLSHRQGSVYIQAESDGKMVGSLRWIYNVLQQGVLTHPREKLLHYPLPVGEITGARDVIVCSTNFTTEARHDIVEMCKDMGIKFSASLSRSTTHLITAYPAGDKYTNAIPWNIHTVNHFWLEESYDHWSLRKEGRQHYQAYPPGLSKTVGQVSVTHDIVNKSLSKAKELLNMEITENDGIIQKSASVTTTTNTSASSSSSIRTPQTTAASTIVVAATTSSSSSTSKASAPLRSSSVILTTTSTSPALPTSSTTNRSHHLQPQQHQQQVDTKSFAVKGKRSARAPRDSTVTNQNDNDDENNKEKNDDEDDNENENEAVMDVVEKEATTSISITTKKNGNSDDAGGAPSSSSSNRGKRRRLSENPSSVTSANTSALMTTTEERRESPLTRAARARSTGLVATISPNVSIASSSRRATTMRFLFTGCQPDKELRMKILSMGARIVERVQECTHLIAMKVTRTEKMLMAINTARNVVHFDWLVRSAAKGEFLDENMFAVKDLKNERDFGFVFEETRRRALASPRLFEGYIFYTSENIQPSLTILKRIIENAGGHLLPQNDLDDAIEELRETGNGRLYNHLKFVALGCDEDRDSIMSTFFETPRVPGVEQVYKTDLILNGLIRWKLEFDCEEHRLHLLDDAPPTYVPPFPQTVMKT